MMSGVEEKKKEDSEEAAENENEGMDSEDEATGDMIAICKVLLSGQWPLYENKTKL